MDAKADAHPDTRQRLLESACELFAEKGFAKTTNKDICQQAGANIAAVNYYFESKEKLYAEAWRKAFHDNLCAHPPDGGVPKNAPAEQRLRGRVRALIGRIADENNKSFLIAHKEMASPTPLLKEVMHECLGPLHEEMSKLVRELLGPQVSEQQVRFCETSVVSQCMAIVRCRRRREGREGKDAPPPVSMDEAQAYAEHVSEFSLAAIRAMRERIGGAGTDR